MRQLFQGRWQILACFIAAFACLAGTNIFMLARPVDISPLEQAAASPPTVTAARSGSGTMQQIDISDLDEAAARPVFSPDRRDFVPPLEPVEPVAEPAVEATEEAVLSPPVIKLLGTRVVAGKAAALFQVDTAAMRWFAGGDNINGWEIVEITSGSATLAMADRQIKLTLHDQKNGQADAGSQ